MATASLTSCSDNTLLFEGWKRFFGPEPTSETDSIFEVSWKLSLSGSSSFLIWKHIRQVVDKVILSS